MGNAIVNHTSNVIDSTNGIHMQKIQNYGKLEKERIIIFLKKAVLSCYRGHHNYDYAKVVATISPRFYIQSGHKKKLC